MSYESYVFQIVKVFLVSEPAKKGSPFPPQAVQIKAIQPRQVWGETESCGVLQFWEVKPGPWKALGMTRMRALGFPKMKKTRSMDSKRSYLRRQRGLLGAN